VVSTPALYDCRITHTRHQRTQRRFTHRGYLWLVDLDELPRLPRWLRPLAEFRAGDHLGDPDRSIRANVERWLAERGIDLAGGPVWMLANARVLGYVFNPLSLYWCHRIDGALACVVAEVHNTYGERHCYLLHPDDAGRASAAKEFYVSPFLTVDGHYEMSVPRPGERLAVTVALRQAGSTALAASIQGARRPATARELLRLQLHTPLPTHRIWALIRAHGFVLWLRRFPITPRRSASRAGQETPR
jgi:uncharacterized protein